MQVYAFLFYKKVNNKCQLNIILFIIDIIYTKQIDLKVEQSQGKLFRD